MFTQQEKKILKQYFTNCDEDVFCLINLPEVVKGTLFSRYSRSAKDLRRLFLDEFYQQEALQNALPNNKSFSQTSVNLQKAENFYERILIGYGDDSVAELGGAHLAVENISVLASKSLEEHRIGLSPLEKSSRYVYFDSKVNGDYLFYKPKKILSSKFAALYLKTTRLLFDTYSQIVRQIQPYLKEIYPGDEKDLAYKFSIRAKACDLARGLLPLSAFTNLGIYGNGRAFEYLLIHLFNDPLEEVKEKAIKINEQLKKVLPAFIKRATNERGEKYRQYLNLSQSKLDQELKNLPMGKNGLKIKKPIVTLVDWEKNAIEKIIAFLIFENTSFSLPQALKLAKKLSPRKKEAIIKAAVFGRENRHHKVRRAFEAPYFTFEVLADWGVYKDLMRHRLLTRHRQLFTNELGYFIPEEIKNTPFANLFKKASDAAVEAYCKIKKEFPIEAQYLVIHAAYNRFLLKLNLREAVHLCELRSSPQGHPSYREIAQKIAQEIIKKYPLFASVLKFVDYQKYHLERLSSFQKILKKAEKLKVEVFKD
ncbi:MAG: FAD-dependent thymidylate synthase [Microgenomates group bacterium]